MKVTNQQELNIDQYLSGQMTSEEQASFESEIQTNPELMEEVDIQRNIVEGLKTYRKSQLKAHLQSIDVTPGLWETALQSTPAKVVSGVIAATVVATGVYQMIGNEELVQEVEKEIPIVGSVNVPTEEIQEDATISIVEVDSKVEDQIVADETPALIPEPKIELTQTDNTSVTFTPDIEIPDTDVDQSIEEIATESMDDLEFSSPLNESGSIIQVSTFETKGSLMYSLDHSGLALYGNFSKSPYEVLEINRPEGKDVYLFFTENYFSLPATSVKSTPKLITDKLLLDQLKSIKDNN